MMNYNNMNRMRSVGRIGVETRCLSSCVIETGDVKTRSQTDWRKHLTMSVVISMLT